MLCKSIRVGVCNLRLRVEFKDKRIYNYWIGDTRLSLKVDYMKISK